MRFRKLHISTSLTLALTGSAALAVAIVLGLWILTVHSKTPAHFLPADHTLAIFTSIPDEISERFDESFPMPADSSDHSIAFIKLDDGSIGHAIFKKEKGNGNLQLGSYSVDVSPPKVVSFLREDRSTLAFNISYQRLKRLHKNSKSVIYLKSEVFPESEILIDSMIEHLLLNESDNLMIGYDHDNTTLTAHKKKPMYKDLMDRNLSSQENSVMALHISDPAEFIKTFFSSMPKDDAVVIEGTILYAIEKLFGSSVSFAFHILPLASRSSALHIAQTASGETVFALEGSMNSQKELERRLDELHQSFADNLSQDRITERVLDSRFRARDIRNDTNLIEQKTENKGLWKQTHTKNSTSPRNFLSATRGNEYVISSDSDLFDALIQKKNRDQILLPTPPAPSFSHYAGGKLNTESVSEVLNSPISSSALFGDLTGTILWSLDYNRNVSVLTLSNTQD